MNTYISPHSDIREFTLRMNNIFGEVVDNQNNEEQNFPMISDYDEELLSEPMFN